MQDDPGYYERRAAEEKAAADQATHPAAAQAHETLAQQYAAMAGEKNQQSEMR